MQGPVQHEQKAKAGGSQKAQDQGVEEVDPQAGSQKLADGGKQGEKAQAQTGAACQTEKAGQGAAEQGQGQYHPQAAQEPGEGGYPQPLHLSYRKDGGAGGLRGPACPAGPL